MGWTSQADVDRWFGDPAPDSSAREAVRRIREEAKRFAAVLLERTPPSADQSAAMRKLREATWAAEAAVVGARTRTAGP